MLLVTFHVDGHAAAVPALAVERILPMVALTPLPGAPPPIAGGLNLNGTILPVVDARWWFDAPAPAWKPAQHLLVLRGSNRYVLWVDRVDSVVDVPDANAEAVRIQTERPLVRYIAELGGETVTVLSPEGLDPGPMLVAAGSGP